MPLSQTAIWVLNPLIINNVSMAANVSSEPVDVREIKTIAFQAVWTDGGSPVGIMEIQGSANGGRSFTRIQGSVLNVSGNAGSNGWNISGLGYTHLLFLYTKTSGDALLTVDLSGKTI